MLKKLLPNQFEESIYHIDLDKLRQKGIKGIIADLDNTLVEWDREAPTEQLREWIRQLKRFDIQLVIVSNNTLKRVKVFAEPENVHYIHSARKPLKKAFIEACKIMNLKKEEVVIIGDQIFTDVLGGNRVGIHTILVVPVAKTDSKVTRFNRKMERIVLWWMKKRGMINWEVHR